MAFLSVYFWPLAWYTNVLFVLLSYMTICLSMESKACVSDAQWYFCVQAFYGVDLGQRTDGPVAFYII